jgi:histidinol-phosphate phosphatase family protein
MPPRPLTIDHVILDRDGVLNRERADGWVTSIDEWEWEPGALHAIDRLARSGVRISVVTNQSCIGRGVATRTDVDRLHREITDELRHRFDVDVDVYVCPHVDDDRCACRKPEPGLILEAMRRHGSDPGRTIVIGDDVRDVTAGTRAGVGTILVRTGKGRRVDPELVPHSTIADSLAAATDALLGTEAATSASTHPLVDDLRALTAVLVAAEAGLPDAFDRAVDELATVLGDGGTIHVIGNGGSAAQAQHFAAELTGSGASACRAIALTTDSSAVTAIANDHGYSEVFATQFASLARPGDALLAISTSGRSPSVLAAARRARSNGHVVVGLTGGAGHELVAASDTTLVVPSEDVRRIQEVHAVCLHALADALVARLVRTGDAS